MKILETERLILREYQIEDAPFIFKLLNTPTWLKYIGDRGVYNVEDAEKYITNRLRKSYAESGFGFWMTELKASGTPVGMCGLVKRDTLEYVDIGFAFLPEFERKGFGSESASATLDFAKNQLKLNRIVAITVPENVNSIKLLEKIGLSFEKMIQDGEDEEELMLFGVDF